MASGADDNNSFQLFYRPSTQYFCFFTSKPPCDYFLLQVRESRLRVGKSLTNSHTAAKWQNWNSKPDLGVGWDALSASLSNLVPPAPLEH